MWLLEYKIWLFNSVVNVFIFFFSLIAYWFNYSIKIVICNYREQLERKLQECHRLFEESKKSIATCESSSGIKKREWNNNYHKRKDICKLYNTWKKKKILFRNSSLKKLENLLYSFLLNLRFSNDNHFCMRNLLFF